MTSYTTELNIPYPDPADSACSVDDSLEAAAEVVGGVLTSVLAALRDKVNVPAFMVSQSPGGTIYDMFADYSDIPDRISIAFDTVDFDPNGLADLERDNHTVTIPNCEDGSIMFGAFVMIAGMPAGSRHRLYPLTFQDRGSSMFMGLGGSSDPAGGYISTIFEFGDGNVNVQYRNSAGTSGTSVRASMWAIRLAKVVPW